ncbi:serine hydrolase domain-containing protein [Streptomyces sp. NBC_00859]|uniref:serine hydrolase domain-containing protein n=1 Tax=Streptomyces sp. NBC_00859 TaxID=2903682 RepID=UPI00386B9777|nr:beta-lactamase family protein [Streptomyces sp. NBC_00859]
MTATGQETRTVTGTAGRLAAAAQAVDAPGIVIAVSDRGRRTVHCGGSAPPPPVPRDQQRYEIGSASKTLTGLLLAELVHAGRLGYDDAAARYLTPGCATPDHGAAPRTAAPLSPAWRHTRPGSTATLRHLITHTAGLPALPADFYPQALRRWSTAPYADYPAERVVAAFLRNRPRHRPGTRWHYSNFGASVLGHALAAATATPWEELIGHHVLAPLGLTGTRLHPDTAGADGADAPGHRPDGVSPVPGLAMGGFQPAGAVRATPGDLLTYLEAHLDPAGSAAAALRAVRRPVLRRGIGHRHTHTLTWFQHPSPQGPLYFHAGATTGQQAFIGFRPDTHTAVVAVATRRIRMRDTFVATAYALLSEA